ncbi:MAG: outer membrane lipoprotein-sorting protein [Gammaproteobacteria bacterium]|nr:outer membrane lipoprotein-sorting protein [Gammaproteobacteria bacterium]
MRATCLLFALTLITPLHVFAETPEEKGLAIAKEVDRRDTGWGDMQAEMHMTLKNRQGQHSTRKIRNKTLEVQGDGDKSLIVFDDPADVKGTAFLSYTHATKPDEQWLYLPALKRVKRISSSNKSGPFMGSEFAFEDISSQEVDKYTYKYLKEEMLDGKNVFLIEQYPAYKHSGYTRQQIWIDQTMYAPLKTVFYDRKNSLLKTLTFKNYKQYLNQYWRPNVMEMLNHQSGKSTTLNWKDYKFKVGFTNRDFDRNSLKRAR